MTDFIRRLSHVDMSEYHAPVYDSCSDERDTLCMKLKKTLSDDDLKLFEAYIDASGKCEEESMCFGFSKGVTMAVQIILGAFAD